MCWPSTGMSRISARADIGLHDRVLGDGPDAVIDAAEVDDCAGRWGSARAVSLDAAGVYDTERRVRAEGFEGGDLGSAGTPDPPRLLQYAGAPASPGTHTPRDVVV